MERKQPAGLFSRCLFRRKRAGGNVGIEPVIIFDNAQEKEGTFSWKEDEPLPLNAPETSASALATPTPTPTVQPAASKRILIYHTHTHEAYAQEEGNEYVETGAWRTADADHSVVRVGAELASLLRMYGFEVTHDTTDNEMPVSTRRIPVPWKPCSL